MKSDLWVKRLLTAAVSVSLATCLTPCAAWATIEEGDQSSPTEEEIAAAVAEGLVPAGPTDQTLGADGADADGRFPYQILGAQTDASVGTQASKVTCPYDITEYSGASMYETAVAQAKAAYVTTDSAIIAGPGDAWVDALASAGLAASKGPILFSEKNSINSSTLQALKDLGVKSVIIVGGTKAVGEGVVKNLKEAGIEVEKRLAGADCFETQLEIFEYGLENDLWNTDYVFMATAGWFADALSASPVAYAKKAPVFLVDGKGNLSKTQKTALTKAAKEKGIGKHAALVGGPAVMSNATYEVANGLIKEAGSTGAADWLYGDDQYSTSTAIADWAVNSQGFTWNNVAFTTGNQPYDALAGSVLQGATKSVMLLLDSRYNPTLDAAYNHRSSISAMRFFGGKRALTSNCRIALADKFGFPYAALPNFRLYLDAGHGWNDMNNNVFAGGAESGDFVEYELTKDLAGRVANILRSEYGVDLFLNDDGGPYRYRHAEAVAEMCDMIVSIHFNAGGGSGSLVLVHSYNNAEMSWPLANKLHPYLLAGMGLYDYGIRGQEVAILGGQLPATLLEICFIDSGYDMTVYTANKDRVARKLAEGIVS